MIIEVRIEDKFWPIDRLIQCIERLTEISLPHFDSCETSPNEIRNISLIVQQMHGFAWSFWGVNSELILDKYFELSK
jgi:hypothetical protein